MNDSTIVTESTKRFKWVGTRPIRPDGVPKVTGRALYGADLKMPGMIYGKVLRSPHAHARIKSIDTSAAEKLTGVKAVVTSKDLPQQKFDYIGPERVAVNFWHVTRNIMAREKVLYEGHAVAAVAAISASITPSTCSNTPCTPQKQPPARTATSREDVAVSSTAGAGTICMVSATDGDARYAMAATTSSAAKIG